MISRPATSTLHFSGQARQAALHLLGGDFGDRIRQVASVSDVAVRGFEPIASDVNRLTIAYDPESIRFQLSTGERILLRFLESMQFTAGSDFAVCDLAGIDDPTWDRVIATLFILRGRAFEVAS